MIGWRVFTTVVLFGVVVFVAEMLQGASAQIHLIQLVFSVLILISLLVLWYRPLRTWIDTIWEEILRARS